MARKVQVLLVDDLDGKELGDQGETVAFGLAGERYEIDLSRDNAKKFREFMGTYVEHARNVTRQGGGRRHTSGGRRSTMDREQSLAVREWARANGWPELPNRGRIPAEVTEAYHQRGQTKIETPAPKAPSLQEVKQEVPAKVNGTAKAEAKPSGNSPKADKPGPKGIAKLLP